MQPNETDGSLTEFDQLAPNGEDLVVPLYVEEIEVSRRKVDKSVVRVTTVTRSRDHLIDEALTHEHVEIEHVAVGRYVDAFR